MKSHPINQHVMTFTIMQQTVASSGGTGNKP